MEIFAQIIQLLPLILQLVQEIEKMFPPQSGEVKRELTKDLLKALPGEPLPPEVEDKVINSTVKALNKAGVFIHAEKADGQ